MKLNKYKSIRKSLFIAAGAMATATIAHTTQASADSVVTVQSGQTLSSIAAANNASISTIASANNIKNINMIFVGQRLTIPNKTTTQTNTNNTSSNNNSASNGTYTVKSGDTLWRIAVNNGLKLGELISKNNLKMNSIIYPGQKLVVSGSTSQTSNSGSNNVRNNGTTNNTNSTSGTNTPSQNNASSYTVKSGDTLWHIATTHGLKLGELINLNNVNINDIIYPGQVLTLSSKTSTQPTGSSNNQPVTATPAPSNETKVASSNTQEATPVTSSAPTGSYTVKKGDTLNNISKATGVSVATLAGSNNIKNMNAIYPGQILVLSSTTPAQTVAPSSVTPAPAQSSQPTAPAQSQPSVANTTPAASTAPAQAATTVTPAQKPVAPSAPAAQPATSSNWESLAKSLIGTPYVWGGKTPAGFDCSGFVAYVLNHSGRTSNFPSYTVAQESVVTQIPVSQAQPGDILFWGDHGSTYHDAIYLGNNQFIDAPQPGDTVGIHQMYPSWMPSFAGRVN